MPFDITQVRSWKICRDFKNSWNWGTVVALSVSAVAFIGMMTFASMIPQQPKLSAIAGKDRRLFIPSREWKQVDDDHICPPGLEFKIDLATGMKLARWS